MSVFGDMDMDKVPDDPFFVPADNYWAVCTSAKLQEKEGSVSLVLKWNIDDEESPYNNRSVNEWYTLPEGFPDVDFEDMTTREQQSLSFLKKRLRRGFDLSEGQMAELDDWSELVGSEAYLKVTNAEVGDRKFSNVGDAISRREWEENMKPAPTTPVGADSFGL